MKTKITYLLLFIPLLFMSCGSPSEEVETYELIHLIRDMTARLNTYRDRPDRNKLLRKEIFSLNNIIIARKGCSIKVRSKTAEVTPQTIVSSLDGNRFIVNRPFYVTTKEKFTLLPIGFEGTKIYISLDKKNWYDIRGGNDNILFDYHYETELDEPGNSIALIYRLSFLLNKELKKARIKTDKEVITLKKGMVFTSHDEQKITHDLNKKILHVPAGTVFTSKISIEGNLIETQGAQNLTGDGEMGFNFIRDIYIYLRKKIFSLSFDRINWDVSILSFRLKQKIEVKSTTDNEVEFNFNWKAYNTD